MTTTDNRRSHARQAALAFIRLRYLLTGGRAAGLGSAGFHPIEDAIDTLDHYDTDDAENVLKELTGLAASMLAELADHLDQDWRAVLDRNDAATEDIAINHEDIA